MYWNPEYLYFPKEKTDSLYYDEIVKNFPEKINHLLETEWQTIDFFYTKVSIINWLFVTFDAKTTISVEWYNILRLWAIKDLPNWEQIIETVAKNGDEKPMIIYLKRDFSILKDNNWHPILHFWKTIKKRRRNYAWIIVKHWTQWWSAPAFLNENLETMMTPSVTINPFEK